jgi:hypothetical protein
MKKLGILVLIALMTVVLAMNVNAVVPVVTTEDWNLSSAVVGADVNLTINITQPGSDSAGDHNITNITLFGTTPGGTRTYINDSINVTVNQTRWSFTFDSTLFMDSNITINLTLYNGTEAGWTYGMSYEYVVSINNNAWAEGTYVSITPSDVSTGTDTTPSFDIGTSEQCYEPILTIAGQTPVTPTANSSNSGFTSTSGELAEGTYMWNLACKEYGGAGTSRGSKDYTFNIDVTTGAGKGAAFMNLQQSLQGGNVVTYGLIALLVYFAFFRKKKRR